MERFLAILLFTVLLLCLSVSATDYHPERTKIIGVQFPPNGQMTNRVNALFRSNIPEKDGEYLFDDVLNDMVSQALNQRGILVDISSVYVITYSLVSEDDDTLPLEQEWYEANPERGTLINWPIHGQAEDPDDFSDEDIQKYSRELGWMEDDIEGLLSDIQSRLNDFSGDKNVFVLIHCVHGHDRTGEVAGAYGIRLDHLSWEQVNALNYEINGGDGSKITEDNQRALTWYCHHLQYHEGYTDLTCTHMNTNSNNKMVPPMMEWDITSTDDIIESSVNMVLIAAVSAVLGALFIVLVIVAVIGGVFLWREYKKRAAMGPEYELTEGEYEFSAEEQSTQSQSPNDQEPLV